MRPRRIVIDGLACFAEKQDIDFKGLELFAISGPTGAGKSTLLDAMTFALFGTIPRVSKQVAEMISTSRDRMSVTLDFEVGGRVLRVTRSRGRTGAAKAQLDEFHGSVARSLANGVRVVDSEIGKILGLDAETFTQCVVLPQGEFARFLRSEPGVRQAILSKLLRLDVYDEMQKLANDRSRVLTPQARECEKLLAEHFGDATEERREEMRDRLEASRAELVELTARKQNSEAEVVRLRHQYQQTAELTDAREAEASLVAESPAIEAAKSKLRRSEQAKHVVPSLEGLERTRLELDDATASYDDCQSALSTAETDLTDAASRFGNAEAAAAKIPGLRVQVDDLSQIIGRLPERDELIVEVAKLDKTIGVVTQTLSGAREKTAKASDAQIKASTRLETAKAKLESLAFDEAEYAALDTVNKRALQLGMRRGQLGELHSNLVRTSSELDSCSTAVAAAETEARSSAGVVETCEMSLGDAEQALREAEISDRASFLRHQLSEGQPCPVCEQRVQEVPLPSSQVDLHALERVRMTADLMLNDAKARATQATITLKTAQAKQSQGLAQRATLESEIAEREAWIRNETSEIRTLLGSYADAIVEPIESALEERLTLLKGAQKESSKLQKVLADAEQGLLTAQNEQKLASADEAAAAERLSGLCKQAETKRSKLVEINEAIKAVTEVDCPKRERERIVNLIDRLEAERIATATRLSDAKAEHSARVSTLEAVGARRAKARAALDRESNAVSHLVETAGFADVNEVRTAVLDVAEAEEIGLRIERHGRNLHTVKTRIAELETALGGILVDKATLDDADRASTACSERHADVNNSVAVATQQLADLERKIDEATKRRAELEQTARELETFDTLALDLRADRFRAWLLDDVFKEFVRGASSRLTVLTSGRYALDFEDREIYVIDHENADSRRISDTLSGGETFLASLAMALELSAQVQRSAGAVSLDSLFIDEGFGTLDPETLRTVADTLQGLPVGGRMVGVITHIHELRDEFTQKILVTKRSGGSKVEVLGGAGEQAVAAAG